MNINANEITYVKFNCKFEKNNIVKYYVGGGGSGSENYHVYNPAELQYDELEEYDWKKETLA